MAKWTPDELDRVGHVEELELATRRQDGGLSHRLGALTAEQDAALATTPADELLSLPMLQPDQVTDSLHAGAAAAPGLTPSAPASPSPPLARNELTGPRSEGYRRMIVLSPARRAGTPDEVGTLGALLMGSEGAFITGSDFLMDGGVTASYFYGDLAPS
jgi:hypothetical protein